MAIVTVAGLIMLAARFLAAAGFALTLVIAATQWATRRGTITAFGPWARFVRGWGDPLLRSMERRVVRAGGNPQDAPGWLIAAAVVAGLILIATVGWLLSFVLGLVFAIRNGQGTATAILVDTLFSVLMGALLIRVISSWLGISPYAGWMRPVVLLTDWILEPIRRILPTAGMFDFSPMVAYFLLYFVKNLLLRSLVGG